MTRLRLGSIAFALAVLATSLPASAQPATALPRPPGPRTSPACPGPGATGGSSRPGSSRGHSRSRWTATRWRAREGEAALKGRVDAELKRADGTVVRWKESTSWSDAFGVDEALGLAAPDSGTAYAYALVKRAAAGPALLSVGSDDGVRVWVNGKLVHERRGTRPLTFDEDRVPVELEAGRTRCSSRPSSGAGRGRSRCGSSSRARSSPRSSRSGRPCSTRSRARRRPSSARTSPRPRPEGRTCPPS